MGKGLLRGADIVARTLERLGVTRIFALSGNHIMPIFDALLSTRIEIIHVRHEAACVHMADAWGRFTGEVGVALVTGGQGQANGAAALFTALAAESPVLLLSGHAALAELGSGAFQELAQADIARPMTKASWTTESVATLAADVTRAFVIAQEGRPGPVHLALPIDLLDENTSPQPFGANDTHATASANREFDSSAIAALLRAAERPVILVGPALCTPVHQNHATSFEARTGIPVIGMQSPRGINDPGLGCLSEVLAQADLLVLIGKPLDFTLKFGGAPIAPSCRFAVFDPDERLIARASRLLGSRLVASAVAGTQPFLTALQQELESSNNVSTRWSEQVRQALSYLPPSWSNLVGASGCVHPVELCHAVDRFLAQHPHSTLICDGGEIGQWPRALVRTKRRLINGVSGTIGASIPFALAAKLLTPDQPVVAILGDGTFGFHMAEFDTAVRYNLPIIAVVGNDARWNAEYQIQLRTFGADRAKNCDLLPSRYDLVVEALGGFGAFVTSVDELHDALTAAHASGKPSCINVMIESVPAPAIKREAAV